MSDAAPKGYLIANLTVTDPEGYAPYRELVPAVIAQFGGRYLVRAGAVQDVEGALGFDRCVVVEFDSVDAVRAFYFSEAYAPLLAIRSRTTRSHVSIVAGFVAP